MTGDCPRREGQHRLVLRKRRCARHLGTGAQQERVTHDLALLFDAIAVQRDAGPERIVVAAPRMPCEREEDTALMLPDVSPVFTLLQLA